MTPADPGIDKTSFKMIFLEPAFRTSPMERFLDKYADKSFLDAWDEIGQIKTTNNMEQTVDLQRIAHLIGNIFYYGKFKGETANEQELEKLLIKVGCRYRTEDEVLAACGMSRAEAEMWWGSKRNQQSNDMLTEDTQREERQDAHNIMSEVINNSIGLAKAKGLLHNAKDISDGYHTFGELYEFRAILTLALFKSRQWEDGTHGRKMVWRSLKHSDATMFDGMFVVGYDHEPGKQITFHYHLDKWGDYDFADTLDKAPEWDGHTPADVLERLRKL